LIFDRLPATLSLVLGGAVVWVVAGLGVGIVSARRAGSRLDRASMGTALVLVSAPEYWLGLLMLFFFASDIGKVHVFPGAGSYVGLTAEPAKWFTSLIMPWLVVAAGTAAIYARLIRGSLIETMGEDYIRTARAKGLSERRVVLRHGLRAAINPIVTVLGVDIAILLGSSVLVETVFDIPGIGRLNYIAITHSDYPIVQGTVLFASLFVVVANIVVDIAYAFLDPRVRYS
ncbi:MAG TPA: ABC transporter permease, partial [Solirubrobacteraceae bacterium]